MFPDRQQLHKQIISSFIDHVQPPPIDGELEAWFLVGLPGSGKTTYVRNFPPENYVNLDLDEIKRQLPEYEEQKNLKASMHREAIHLNNMIFEEATAKQLNIIQNGTGIVRPVYTHRIHKLSELSYHTKVIFFKVGIKEAMKRMKRRARTSDRREISLHEMKALHVQMPECFKLYKRLTDSFLIVGGEGNLVNG